MTPLSLSVMRSKNRSKKSDHDRFHLHFHHSFRFIAVALICFELCIYLKKFILSSVRLMVGHKPLDAARVSQATYRA